MALTQLKVDQVERHHSERFVDARNVTGSTIVAFTFVKVNGHYSAELPTVTAVNSTGDIPVAFLKNDLLNNTNSGYPSSLSKAIDRGEVTVTSFNTTGATIGDFVYCSASGVLTLTETPICVGIVTSLAANGTVYIDLAVYLRPKAITKYTVSHTTLQTAALTNNVTLFTLPAKGMIESVVLKHTTAFSGTGITGYQVSLGIGGSANKYTSNFNVFQAVSDTTFLLSQSANIENFGSSTSIQLFATSVGANLNQSSAGALDIYIKQVVLP